MLDLTSLKKALASLKRAVDRSVRFPEDEEVRDAVIQRFEYSYELSWKMLKRSLKLAAPSSEEIERMSFKELIREAAMKGLVDNPEKWFEFREQRNITSHLYDELKANSVYKTALEFFPAASNLLTKLESA